MALQTMEHAGLNFVNFDAKAFVLL